MNFWVSHFLSAIEYIMIATLPYLFFRMAYLHIFKKKFDKKHEIIKYLFVMYMVGLFSQTIFISIPKDLSRILPLDLRGGINADTFRVFFDSIRKIKFGNYQYFVINVLGNVVAFIPLGLFIPYLFKRRVFGVVMIGFLVSLFIEVIQLLLLRATDVDDVMLNTLGTFIGYCFYRFIYFEYKKRNTSV